MNIAGLNLYKWCCSGPNYIRAGVCLASSENNVRIELKNNGFIVNDKTIVEKLDPNQLLHVISESIYRTQFGCDN